ncbi:MAG: hypothetical protein LBS51_03950 [Oscillospiraceae bacterium]|nr:hypothetical protein [Oscillospiraceae bacterium]
MDQDNKNSSGAPSSDTTSALFVSARKKQLEQQETERRAKEKEEQRIAAEAEVRRLEQEVEERKRRVEEEAAEQKRQAEEETRRIAEEARAKNAEAAANPDAVLGAPAAKSKLPGLKLPRAAASSSASPPPSNPTSPPGGGAQKPAMNKKLLLIIGGAVLAVLAIVIVIFAVTGGGPATEDDVLDILYEYDVAYYMENGYEIWYGFFDDAERVQTAEYFLSVLKDLGEKVSGFNKNSLTSAINELYDEGYDMSMWDTLCYVTEIDGSYYVDLLYDDSYDDSYDELPEDEEYDPAMSEEYEVYTNDERGIEFYYPPSWIVTDVEDSETSAYVAPIMLTDGNVSMLVFNYSGEYSDFLEAEDSEFEDLLTEFAEDTLEDLGSADGTVTDVSYQEYDEYEDGSMDQVLSFVLDDVSCFAALRAFADGTAYGVFVAGLDEQQPTEIIDAVNTIIDSIFVSQ